MLIIVLIDKVINDIKGNKNPVEEFPLRVSRELFDGDHHRRLPVEGEEERRR